VFPFVSTFAGPTKDHADGSLNARQKLHHPKGLCLPVIADTEYALFDLADGAESIRLPLPVQTKETGSRVIPLWKVHGARIRDPRPSWTHKHLAYEAEHTPAHDSEVLSTKS
jgi:hypothetical protein